MENALAAVDNCEFGLWTNGTDIKYLQKEDDAVGFDYTFSDLSDFPGFGENLDDLNRGDRSHSRKPANDSLIKVFKRSHDYIYGNEGRKKDAFGNCSILFSVNCTMKKTFYASARRCFLSSLFLGGCKRTKYG